MPSQLQVISISDSDEDYAECVICSAPLDPQIRGAGERSPVVPLCGHAMHHQCYQSVYGAGGEGMCGVCRKRIVFRSSTDGTDKRARIIEAGQGKDNLRANPSTVTSANARHSMEDRDDPIFVTHGSPGGRSSASRTRQVSETPVVTPEIFITPEFRALTRTTKGEQVFSAMISVNMPARRDLDNLSLSLKDLRIDDPAPAKRYSALQASVSADQAVADSIAQSFESRVDEPDEYIQSPNPAFEPILQDLYARLKDAHLYDVRKYGYLRLFDLIRIQSFSKTREYLVFLFTHALVLVSEDRKRVISRLLSGANANGTTGQTRPGLKLKGSILVQQMQGVKNVQEAGVYDWAFKIITVDEEFSKYIFTFSNRDTMESWKRGLKSAIDFHSDSKQSEGRDRQDSARSASAFDSNSNSRRSPMDSWAPRLQSPPTGPELQNPPGRKRSSIISALKRTSEAFSSPIFGESQGHHGFSPELGPAFRSPVLSVASPPHSNGANLDALAPPSNEAVNFKGQHLPTDLIVICSVSSTDDASGTLARLRALKMSLQLIMSTLTAGDRLCLISYSVGQTAQIRATPFLSLTSDVGRLRLKQFVDALGVISDVPDLFHVTVEADEKIDLIAAINVALDAILGRRTKNRQTAAMLICESSSKPSKWAVRIMNERAVAAKVPFFSIGLGKLYDAAILGLLSSKTHGAWTFVHDIHLLSEAVLAMLGAIFSVALEKMLISVHIQDKAKLEFMPVANAAHLTISEDRNHAHVTIHQLRYGERRDFLLELRLNAPPIATDSSRAEDIEAPYSATDAFMQSMGFSITNSMSRMLQREEVSNVEELHVFDVNASYKDPRSGRFVTRLAEPISLSLDLYTQTEQEKSVPVPTSDPDLVRRRMELAASELIARVLFMVSRRDMDAAQVALTELLDGLHTVMAKLQTATSGRLSKKVLDSRKCHEALEAIVSDVQILQDAFEETSQGFDRGIENFGWQLTSVLHNQQAWSDRSRVQDLLWTIDGSRHLVTTYRQSI